MTTTLDGGVAKKLDGVAMAKLGRKWFSTSLTICCNFSFHVPPFIYFFINYILLLVGMKVLRVACESHNHICVDLIKINGVCHLQKGLKLLFSKLKG
jgi:hypothetical protein